MHINFNAPQQTSSLAITNILKLKQTLSQRILKKQLGFIKVGSDDVLIHDRFYEFYMSIARKAFGSMPKMTREWGLCDDYEVLHTLGKGSSARVFQGVNVLSGKSVVIKLFKKIAPESVKKEIEINCQLLRGLQALKPQQRAKVRFIELLDSLYDPACSHFTLIYQFYHGVPLNELTSTIAQPQALKTVLSLAHTLRFVNKEGLMHRDIKPANVLVTPTGARLFDFGLAKQIGELKTNNFGTKCYKSPEVIYRMPTYGPSVDVWCLGLLFAQLLLNKRHILQYKDDETMLGQVAGLCGLDSQNRTLIPEDILKSTVPSGKSWLQLANAKGLTGPAVQLVRRMLHLNPALRPSLDEIVSDATFRDVQV